MKKEEAMSNGMVPVEFEKTHTFRNFFLFCKYGELHKLYVWLDSRVLSIHL